MARDDKYPKGYGRRWIEPGFSPAEVANIRACSPASGAPVQSTWVQPPLNGLEPAAGRADRSRAVSRPAQVDRSLGSGLQDEPRTLTLRQYTVKPEGVGQFRATLKVTDGNGRPLYRTGYLSHLSEAGHVLQLWLAETYWTPDKY